MRKMQASRTQRASPEVFFRSESGRGIDTNCPQLVGDLIFSVPWGHHRLIIDKFYEKEDKEATIFYINVSLI